MSRLCVVTFALLALAIGELVVTPDGRWLTGPTTITFKEDEITNAQFRYHTTWKTLTPRPTRTTGTLWDGSPISIDRNVIITVIAFNSTVYDQHAHQQHTYIFFSTLVNEPEFGRKMDLSAAWNQIPMISLTSPTGVPVQSNDAPQVAGSMEWLEVNNPSARLFYHGGLKYSGNYNVHLEKKSYRLYFSKKDWGGAGKFDEDIFQNFSTGLRPAHRFENIQFRSGSADSIVYQEWPGRGDSWVGSYATLLRNAFGDELQLQAGHRSAHTRWVHLLDNGMYMGVFHVRERVDANYLADYVGGTKDDHEFNNHCVIRDGNGTLRDRLEATKTSYVAFKQWADVPQLCDYMLMQQYNLNMDVNPCWNWQGYGPYTGSIDGGFQFYGSDIDLSYVDPAGGWLPGGWWSGPFDCWTTLWAERHPDFVQIFHDRLYALFYNDGVMTSDNMIRTMTYLQKMINLAMSGEIARWGTFSTGGRYTVERWNAGINYIINSWLSGTRQTAYYAQLGQRNMLPPGWPPMYSPLQGKINAGSAVTVTNQWAGSTMYCTQDGSDPRAPGGAVVGTNYGTSSFSINVPKSMTLTCRSLTGSSWSPIHQRSFIVKDSFLVGGKIQVTELNYHALDETHAEFIELKNLHSAPIDLLGCKFEGERVKMEFTKSTIIQPGKFLVGTNQRMQFRWTYKQQADFFYSGNLKKNSELKIVDAWDETVVSIEWSDESPWPELAQLGYTLVPGVAFDPAVTGSTKAKNGKDWRFSLKKKGSPWADDGIPVTLTTFDQGNNYLVVNELFLNPKKGAERWVEFRNVGNSPLDISGWGFSDNIEKPTKYVFPKGTVVPTGGFHVMTESQIGWKLNEKSLYLFNEDKDYAMDMPNKALEGFSQGRVTVSNGQTYFAHLVSPTAGAVNTQPFIPDVVISGFGWGIPAAYSAYKYVKLTNAGKKNAVMTGWVLAIGGKDYKFEKKGIHDVVLLPGQSVYLLQEKASINNFKKLFASQWLNPTSLILAVLKADDFTDDIKLQQPDDGTEVTVDRIDTSALPTPSKKRQGAGPIELSRNLPPTFSLDPLSWKTVTLPSPPAVDCQWDSWTQWSKCTLNTQSRTRVKSQLEMFGGVPCDDLTASQTQACSNQIDCTWSAWGAWTSCSKTCGAGTRTRFRTETPAQNGGAACAGLAQVQGPCTMIECPIDCQWNEWSQWTDCDTGASKCGSGIRQRTRDYSVEQFGGIACDDTGLAYDQCEVDCPVVDIPEAPTPTDQVTDVIWGDNVYLIAVFIVFLVLLAIILVAVLVLAVKSFRSTPTSDSGDGYQVY